MADLTAIRACRYCGVPTPHYRRLRMGARRVRRLLLPFVAALTRWRCVLCELSEARPATCGMRGRPAV